MVNESELADSLGVDMLPWQTRLLHATSSGAPLVLTYRRRQDVDTERLRCLTSELAELRRAHGQL